jgi:anti-sigma factor RsiW
MSTVKDPYTEWDAAYVLGALGTDERHAFERHLRGCVECTAQVSELAGMPGLLGLVPVEQATLPEAELSQPRPDGLPRLLAEARRRRFRGRVTQAGIVFLVAAAAVAATVALVLPAPVAPLVPEDLGALVEMRQTVPSPLSANFRLTSQPGGTRIDGSCSYALPAPSATPGALPSAGATPGAPGRVRAYGMYVTDRAGDATQVASWLAGPGTTIPVQATTRLAAQDIVSVDIRSESAGTILLAAEPAG